MRIVQLTRVTAPVASGGRRTIHFTFPGGSGPRKARVGFVDPEHVPVFEGDAAWCELEEIPAVPWPYWRVARLVPNPTG